MLNDDILRADSRGGVAVVTDILRRAYAHAGHTVTFIATHQREDAREDRYTDDFGTCIVLPVRLPSKGRHRRVVSTMPVSARLDTLMAQLRPDVVHAHNLHNFLTYDALRVARTYTENVFLTPHDTFLVSFARVGGQRYEALALSKKPYHMHWWDHLQSGGREYWPLRNWIIRRIVRSCVKHVLPYTHAMEDFLRINGITNTKLVRSGIEHIPPATQEEIQALKEKLNLTSPCVLYGARISGDKGIQALLYAAEHVMKHIPECTFLIIGDRNRLDPYLAKISSQLRSAIRAPGWLNYSELQVAYAACDIVTTPSLYLDNFPTINLEAMRAGRPVVGTCFGGTPEAVIDGETGYIVNPRNTEQYAEKMLTLLRNGELRERMGNAAKQRTETVFSMERYVHDLIALYTEKQ